MLCIYIYVEYCNAYTYICIHIQIYIYIYIYTRMYMKLNYANNRIHEKAFRSDLSTQIKKLSPLTN